jgi:hypothetical protein
MRLAPYYSQTEMAVMNLSEMTIKEVDRRVAERRAANRATEAQWKQWKAEGHPAEGFSKVD